MKVAIVHHHLKPGGVTRVIESALRALQGVGVEALVCSSDLEESVPESLRDVWISVPELAYDVRSSNLDLLADQLERSLESALKSRWNSGPDLWHIHNHGLGKNLAWTYLVARWGVEGRSLFLQIHDFAEDGRPGQYGRLRNCEGPRSLLVESPGSGLNNFLYPDHASSHFACLNRRDYRILEESGIPADRLHSLPNPVSTPDWLSFNQRDPAGLNNFADEVWLYPTRSIRRKNIGEALYWASSMEKGQVVALTLPPNNPESQAVYLKWKAYAERRSLPVLFEVGMRSDRTYEDWVQGCDRFLTTSVAEGFGMAFLESWGWGKSVVGRDLPEVTQDFKEDGIDLGPLYTSLPAPLNVLDKNELRFEWLRDYQRSLEAYGLWSKESEGVAKDFVQHWLDQEVIDFGSLKEHFQEQVLDSVAVESGSMLTCHSLLNSGKSTESRQMQISSNATILKEIYSESVYGLRLKRCYLKILETETGSSAEGLKSGFFSTEKILKAFHGPERFQWLRTEG